MTPLFFDGLPLPQAGQLALYVVGPGFGEGQVVVFPDGKCMVVDCCKHKDVSLSRALVDRLGIDAIDLLVLTHPDLDHLNGVTELVEAIDVKCLWRFRLAAQVTDLAAYWLRTSRSPDARLQALYESLETIADLEESVDSFETSCGYKPWCATDYEVHCVAPTQHDLTATTVRLRRIISGGPHDPELAHRVRDFLSGKRRALGESGNPLSLAVSVRWRTSFRLLLAGDVENGDGNSRSGWRGVLRQLKAAGELELISDLTAVKVAHHGSLGAYLEEAWALHAPPTKRSEVVVIAPFDRGLNPPPHGETLSALRQHARTLVLTEAGGAISTTCAFAGWTTMEPLATAPASAPWAAVIFSGDGTITTHVGRSGCRYG